MRAKRAYQIILVTLLFNLYIPSYAAVPRLTPKPPALSANAYLLLDFHSQQVLGSHDADQKLAPASLTKMMTMYVIDTEIKKGKLKPTDLVLISQKAWRAEGSRMFVEVNKRVPAHQLIKGIIISSGNDASIAMAEHIAGSEAAFVDLMNYHAAKLGMKNTHFTNTTGLPDPNHYTTGTDLAILARTLIQDFPETYKLYAEKNFTFNNIKQANRNRLLWRNQHVDGIKTGHTEDAGYCLVASGKKDNMRLISILLGAKNDTIRTNESNALLTWGFRFFETHQLYGQSEEIKNVRVWMGRENNLPLGTKDPIYVTVSQGDFKNIQASLEIPDVIKAPTQKGQQLGKLTIKLADQVLIEKPIIALKDIESGNVLSRAYDYIALKSTNLIKQFSR